MNPFSWARLTLPWVYGLLGGRLLAGEVLGVDGAIVRAWTNNLELVAARVVIREARARADQAGRLSNPELETGMYPNTRGREGFVTLSLVQRFPLTSRLKLEKAVSKFGIEAAEAEVADRERRLAGEVLEGAVGWLALDSQRQLKALQWTNSQELVRVASAAAGKGEGSTVDATRFRVESERLMLAMRQLESGLAAQEGQLRTLLGMYEAYPIRISGELGTLVPAPTDAEGSGGVRPDLHLAFARRRVAELTLALAKASRWQDVGLGFAGQLQRSEDVPTGLQRDNFVGLQISLPLPLWNRNQGRITEAREAVSRLELESRAVEVRIRSEVDSAWARLQVAEAALKGVDERLLPAAREVEATIARMRSEGQAGMTDLLQARDGRFQAESMRVDALRDVELARGRVAVATGTIGKEGKP